VITLEELHKHQVERDLREVLKTPHGRRTFWWLVDEVSGVFNTSFAGEQTHQTAFHEGKRAVGAELVETLQRLAPEEYQRMFLDAIEDRRLAREEYERLEKERLEQEQKARP